MRFLPQLPRPDPATRALAALGIAVSPSAWIVWLINSGNSRYFIPMASVAAVLAVALLFRLLANHAAGRNGILLALLVAQGTQLALGTEYRWNQAPWDGRWFNVRCSGEAGKPSRICTYRSACSPIPSSFHFSQKDQASSILPAGIVLGPDGANASRVRAMIARSAPHLRVLVSGDQIYPDSALRAPRQSDVDDALRTFGLRVDMSDCETITVHGLRPMVWRPLESSIPAPTAPRASSSTPVIWQVAISWLTTVIGRRKWRRVEPSMWCWIAWKMRAPLYFNLVVLRLNTSIECGCDYIRRPT